MRLSSRSLSEHGDGGSQAQTKILSYVVAGRLCSLKFSLSIIGSQAFVFSNLLRMANESWQTYSK